MKLSNVFQYRKELCEGQFVQVKGYFFWQLAQFLRFCYSQLLSLSLPSIIFMETKNFFSGFKRSCLCRGGSRIFFRWGCTCLLLYFNTNQPHGFFMQSTSCIRKPQVISGGGGGEGVHTPCTLPLDPPLLWAAIGRLFFFKVLWELL